MSSELLLRIYKAVIVKEIVYPPSRKHHNIITYG
jgi:hypothetical protein